MTKRWHVIQVGGSEDAYLAAKSLLLSMGKNTIFCGGPGNGSVSSLKHMRIFPFDLSLSLSSPPLLLLLLLKVELIWILKRTVKFKFKLHFLEIFVCHSFSIHAAQSVLLKDNQNIQEPASPVSFLEYLKLDWMKYYTCNIKSLAFLF